MKNNNKNTVSGLAGFVANATIPLPILEVLTYLCFCFAYFVESRFAFATSISYYAFNDVIQLILGNDIFAFFLGGLVPFLFVNIVVRIPLRKMSFYGVDYKISFYAFELFKGFGMVASGLISIIILFNPVFTNFYKVIVIFTCGIIAIILYCLFMAKHFVKKPIISKFIFNVISTNLIIYMIIVGIEILSMVV